MKARRLLVATALAGTLGLISCKHQQYANTKQPSYPNAPATNASNTGPNDAALIDADIGVVPDPGNEIHANPKGAFYDDGLAKQPKRP